MEKTRINISTDKDLAAFIKLYAAENRTTVAEIFNQYVLSIKRTVEGEKTEQILANPVFYTAMEAAQKRLKLGTAQWHSYDEVFGE
jgi:hypothetical protein